MGVRGESSGPKVNLSVRVSLREAEILRTAAAKEGVFVTQFVLKAALDRADELRGAVPGNSWVWDKR
jgi:uncharacterized protein (DUF1778 family)